MSYCADIYVPKENGMVCVQTGDAATTHTESLAKACFTAGVYYVRDIGYPYAIVQMIECCDTCQGTGKVQRRRGKRAIPYSYAPCKACKSLGQWDAGEPERIGQ